MKRTKIIATIGPASADVETLKKMMIAGMNIARLNFSHGTYASHASLIKNIRSAAEKLEAPIAIIQDLSGPKLRLGEFPDKELNEGETVLLGQHGIPIGRHIWSWIKPGQTIFIDDGLVELVAVRVEPESVEAKVVVGGKIISHKGISLPGVQIPLPAISEKDLQDLAFGLKMGVDFVAQSFVKKADDIRKLKTIIKNIMGKQVPVIAKIETIEGVSNLASIAKAVDGIMVARGDLALNTAQEDVAIYQKQIVKHCLDHGIPVIVATQMLDSMIRNPRPTRAEILDVGNAVIDHADAVMLSGETAFGKYPVKVVETMAKIIQEVEDSSWDDLKHSERVKYPHTTAIAHNLIHFAYHTKTATIAVASFELAKHISAFRPELTTIFVSKSAEELRKANLLWGVLPLPFKADVTALVRNHILSKDGRFIDATIQKSAMIQTVP